LDQPVSGNFRARAKGGGLYPSFVGKMEQLQVNLYPLGDYDPEFDSRLDSLSGVSLVVDSDPNGTWRLETEKPLPAGEYVARFRAMGVDNWDGQAVYFRIDPTLKPAPASGPE